jgi:hypothetical protein
MIVHGSLSKNSSISVEIQLVSLVPKYMKYAFWGGFSPNSVPHVGP